MGVDYTNNNVYLRICSLFLPSGRGSGFFWMLFVRFIYLLPFFDALRLIRRGNKNLFQRVLYHTRETCSLFSTYVDVNVPQLVQSQKWRFCKLYLIDNHGSTQSRFTSMVCGKKGVAVMPIWHSLVITYSSTPFRLLIVYIALILSHAAQWFWPESNGIHYSRVLFSMASLSDVF